MTKILLTIFLFYNSLFSQTRDTVLIHDTKLDSTGLLSWTTTRSIPCIKLSIQQNRWNKWITLEKIEYCPVLWSSDMTLNQEDSTKVNYHSGLNKFRIVVFTNDSSEVLLATKELDFQNTSIQTSGWPLKVDQFLTLPSESNYTIYNSLGDSVKTGISKKINVSTLTRGVYYINANGTIKEFIKK